MRRKITRRTFAIIGLSTGIALGAGIVGAATASEDATKFKSGSEYAVAGQSNADSGSALSIEQVMTKVKNKGFTEIYEVERKRGMYEVKARNEKGVLMELYVDAKTGEVLKSKREN